MGSLPLDRDREGVIETDMDLEDDTADGVIPEDTTDRANPVEISQNSSIAPTDFMDINHGMEGAGKAELDDSSSSKMLMPSLLLLQLILPHNHVTIASAMKL